MKIGDYVRYNEGISRIEKIEEIMWSKEIHLHIGKHTVITPSLVNKYSEDLITLIEVGDFVNGRKVLVADCKEKIIMVDNNNSEPLFLLNNELKEILTKEQYEREVFRV